MKQKPRDPKIDPRPGDKVEHVDGGTMYVKHLRGGSIGMVFVQRRPGAEWMEAKWMRLTTFIKFAKIDGTRQPKAKRMPL